MPRAVYIPAGLSHKMWPSCLRVQPSLAPGEQARIPISVRKMLSPENKKSSLFLPTITDNYTPASLFVSTNNGTVVAQERAEKMMKYAPLVWCRQPLNYL